MFLLSQVIGKSVRNRDGEKVASVRDLVVRIQEKPYPVVVGVVARQGRRDVRAPWGELESISDEGVSLSAAAPALSPFVRAEDEALMARHLLDRQLIDVEGRRIIRVADLQLSPSSQGYLLTGAVVGERPRRRIGLPRLGGGEEAQQVLDWTSVEFFASADSDLHLEVDHERLARMPAADIANLVDALDYQQGAEIIAALDVDTAAEAMEEVAPERQAHLVVGMDVERAADIIERMAPDDAADLLADLADEKARDLLSRMEDDASGDVKDLLAYPENSAGGLMTPQFVGVTPDMTVGEAIEHMRHLDYHPDIVYYVYVVDSLDYDTPLLLGVASLRDMIMAGLTPRMEEVMTTDFHRVAPNTPTEEVAALVGEYNLLAVPVVEEGQILGIVTVDDVLELLLPADWRERLPRLFR